ncbi:MAG: hypothetical protein Q9223_000467 [Gallowayella weberi]
MSLSARLDGGSVHRPAPRHRVYADNPPSYLILVRPPVREMCTDALEDLWRNYDDAKAPTAKILKKIRPEVLAEESSNAQRPPSTDGIQSLPPGDGLPSASVKGEGIQAPANTVAAAG